MQNIMIIELGMGVDMHGQDITKAAVRAIQDALYHNSLPGMRTLLGERGIDRMQVHVRLGLPCDHERLDVSVVRATFPYGDVSVEIVQGGMLTPNAHMLPEKGDKNDQMYVVTAAIEVGY